MANAKNTAASKKAEQTAAPEPAATAAPVAQGPAAPTPLVFRNKTTGEPVKAVVKERKREKEGKTVTSYTQHCPCCGKRISAAAKKIDAKKAEKMAAQIAKLQAQLEAFKAQAETPAQPS